MTEPIFQGLYEFITELIDYILDVLDGNLRALLDLEEQGLI